MSRPERGYGGRLRFDDTAPMEAAPDRTAKKKQARRLYAEFQRDSEPAWSSERIQSPEQLRPAEQLRQEAGPPSAGNAESLQNDNTQITPVSEKILSEKSTSDKAPSGAVPLGTSGHFVPKSGGGPTGGKRPAREARSIYASRLRMEKSADRLDAARVGLSRQKPTGVTRTVGRSVSYGALAKAHGKIHEVEHENVGVEAAHRAELLGERAGRAAVRRVNQRFRTQPARQAVKWEQKYTKAIADHRFRQMVSAVNRNEPKMAT